jgi:hypothetical protein
VKQKIVGKTVAVIVLVLVIMFARDIFSASKSNDQKIILAPSPTPINLFPYKVPAVKVKRAYLTFLIGDSIMASLGKNANSLRLDLIKRYPEHEFVNYNYGFGSTNILSVPERLHKQTTYLGENFPAVNDQTFDLIIFDTFAYNPLSQYPLQEGLKKQTETFDAVIKETILNHPNSVVAIMTPIGLSKDHFAQGVYNLTPEARKQWVEERQAYIDNAITYAKNKNIPLINVYEKSLKENGEVNMDYISSQDYIHPSTAGINLISQTIADFIYQNHIFPE